MTAPPTEIAAQAVLDCVDLRPWANNNRYRWRFEESFRAERDPELRDDSRWYVEVLCRRGLLYPHGDDLVCAWVESSYARRELLRLDPSIQPRQLGDSETTFLFPSRLLDAVAAVLRPKRKPGRSATPEDRRRLAQTGFQAGVQGPESVPERAQSTKEAVGIERPA